MSWAQRDRTLQETFTFMDKEPKSLFSLNEERYVSKEVTENDCIRGQIMSTRNKP